MDTVDKHLDDEPAVEPAGSEVPVSEQSAAAGPLTVDRPAVNAPRAEPPRHSRGRLPALMRSYWKHTLAVAAALAIVGRRLRRR